jgi:hypothetical protein
MFDGIRRQFDDLEQVADEIDDQIAEAEATANAAPSPGVNETVVTKTEETRPDGTRIVTTITRTKIFVTKTSKSP